MDSDTDCALYNQLNGAARKVPQRRAELLKPKVNFPQPPPGISRNGLEDARKWLLPDIPAYGKAMKSLHADIAALKESWGPFHQALGEIEGDMLKGTWSRYLVETTITHRFGSVYEEGRDSKV